MCQTLLVILYPLFHLILSIALCAIIMPHLTDKETKAEQNKGLTKPELHSKDSKPDLSDY